MRRRQMIGATATLVGGSSITARSRSQTPWPDRPLRLVVPFPAGGPIDVMGRLFAQKLGERLGQPVAVENKAGAAGAIGSADIARSRADGYSLLVATASTHALYPLLARQPLYDSRKEFTPISILGSAPVGLVAIPSMPATLAELVALVRGNPGRYRYGSPGTGTLLHLTIELLKLQAGKLDIVHVPYRGAAPALNDLLGGHIEMMGDSIGTALPHHRAGRSRILAVASASRVPLAPDIPTVDEALGSKGFEASLWSMLAAPANLPDTVRDKLGAATSAVIADPGYVSELNKLSIVDVPPMTPAQLGAFLEADIARFKPVVEATGVSIE